MDVIEHLLGRNSRAQLTDPAPSGETRRRIFQTALRAPDHALLRPWQFILVEGEQRDKLGEVFRQAAVADDPTMSDSQQEKMLRNPRRAPLVVVAVCKFTEHPKVPKIEQVLSTGSAVQQMLLALESEGFGGMWRTGAMAYHPMVKEALGLTEQDDIVGFLYIGTPSGKAKVVQPLEVEDFFKAAQLPD